MDSKEDNASPQAAAPATSPPVRPRPSWYLRWGKASALWICGFAVGAAVAYGAIWGKEQYDGYHTLQAMNLPAPVADNSAAKLFSPVEPPVPALAAADAVAAAAVPVPAKVLAPKSVRAKATRASRTRAVLARAPARRTAPVARPAVRLAERRAAPRILEIRRTVAADDIRRPCRRGDLARECYVAR